VGRLSVVVGGGGLCVGDHCCCSPKLMKSEDMRAEAEAEVEGELGPYRRRRHDFIGPSVDLEMGGSFETKRAGEEGTSSDLSWKDKKAFVSL